MFNFKKITATVLVLLLLLFTLSGCSKEYDIKETFVFGGIMPFTFWGYGKNTDAAYREMLEVLNEIDRLTNINRDGESDVLNINLAKANEDVEIDFLTFDILQLAKQYYAQTDGLFNPAAYPLSYLWGIEALGFTDFQYDPDYERTELWGIPKSFENSDIQRKLPLPDYSEVLRVREFCDLDDLTVFERDGKYYAVKKIDQLMVDLGGISKGYVTDLCGKICEKYGIKSAKIDLSGNLLYLGKYQNKSDWNIGISYPYEGEDYFCAFSGKDLFSAVTSGDYQRFRMAKDGENIININHIINSKTGLPYTLTYNGEGYENIKGGVTSCTVISGVSAFADAYAKAACILGIENAVSFFEEKGVKAIMYTTDNRCAFTSGAEPVLTDEYKLYKSFTEV